MAWGIVCYATTDGKVPAEEFLDKCPAKVEARLFAVQKRSLIGITPR